MVAILLQSVVDNESTAGATADKVCDDTVCVCVVFFILL